MDHIVRVVMDSRAIPCAMHASHAKGRHRVRGGRHAQQAYTLDTRAYMRLPIDHGVEVSTAESSTTMRNSSVLARCIARPRRTSEYDLSRSLSTSAASTGQVRGLV